MCSCTADSCDAKTGCKHTPLAVACDDGDACTSQDACQVGVCKAGGPVSCDDADPCTADACDATKGCVTSPIGGCGKAFGFVRIRPVFAAGSGGAGNYTLSLRGLAGPAGEAKATGGQVRDIGWGTTAVARGLAAIK